MRESLVEKLCCPLDLSPLGVHISDQDSDGHIMLGQLECMTCQRIYPIQQGVPDLLPMDSVRVDGSNMDRLQAATVERFGFEWLYFRNWGWLTEYSDISDAEEKFCGGLVENTHRAFWSKSLYQQEDLHPGLLVLDAGCGNGRFTNQAARTGAEVIGIDLGWGVHAAFEHTRSLSNVHIIRGDIIRLPFRDRTFDRIFSIGVLHHTGNAEAAFDSLAHTLRLNGLIVAHVYGQGRQTYEALDALIRAVTTRLPIRMQMSFARTTAAIARWLRRGGKRHTRFYRRVYNHINLLPTEHHMYDWWSAPIATHHTQDEVQGWFAKNQLELVRTNPALGDAKAERMRRRGHGAITVLGRCSMAGQR